MPPFRRVQWLFLPALPTLLGALVLLGIRALRQASVAGGPEFWLMLWMLAFVVGLPLLVVGMAVAGHLQRHPPSRAIIPITGVKIPRTGQ